MRKIQRILLIFTLVGAAETRERGDSPALWFGIFLPAIYRKLLKGPSRRPSRVKLLDRSLKIVKR